MDSVSELGLQNFHALISLIIICAPNVRLIGNKLIYVRDLMRPKATLRRFDIIGARVLHVLKYCLHTNWLL